MRPQSSGPSWKNSCLNTYPQAVQLLFRVPLPGRSSPAQQPQEADEVLSIDSYWLYTLILSGLFTVNPSEHGACLQVPGYTARGTPPPPLGFQWLHQPQPTRLPVRETQLPAPSPRAGLKLAPWGNCTAADSSEDACAPRPGWDGCWRHPV